MHEIIKRFIPIVDMIAKTFGKDCEVVLHDLTMPEHSVVYTVNNHVTNRQVGQSFDYLVTHVLLSQNFEGDCSANYYFRTADNRLIKSSTALMRNDENKVVAAMCINIDTTTITGAVNWLLDAIPNLPGSSIPAINPEPPLKETESIVEIADDLIEQIIGSRDTAELKRDDKIEIIRFMEQKGIFLIKGAIDKVADKLGISKVTIYSYLDEIKSGSK